MALEQHRRGRAHAAHHMCACNLCACCTTACRSHSRTYATPRDVCMQYDKHICACNRFAACHDACRHTHRVTIAAQVVTTSDSCCTYQTMLDSYKELIDKYNDVFDELDGRELEPVFDSFIDIAKAPCSPEPCLKAKPNSHWSCTIVVSTSTHTHPCKITSLNCCLNTHTPLQHDKTKTHSSPQHHILSTTAAMAVRSARLGSRSSNQTLFVCKSVVCVSHIAPCGISFLWCHGYGSLRTSIWKSSHSVLSIVHRARHIASCNSGFQQCRRFG
jgi:hypothetical protein